MRKCILLLAILAGWNAYSSPSPFLGCYDMIEHGGKPWPMPRDPDAVSSLLQTTCWAWADDTTRADIPGLELNFFSIDADDGRPMYGELCTFLDRGTHNVDRQGEHFKFQGHVASKLIPDQANIAYTFDLQPQSDGNVFATYSQTIDWDGGDHSLYNDTFLLRPRACPETK